MKPSFLIIGADSQWEEEALILAAKQRGHSARFLNAQAVEIRLQASAAALFYESRDITRLFQKSRLIFRRARGAQEKMITLALLARNRKVPFTDSVTSIASNLNKAVFMPSVQTGCIRHIETSFVARGESATSQSRHSRFPVLLKPVHGRHGEGVEIAKDPAELRRCLADANKAMMLQPFLNIESEYRVFVVGCQALGVIRKIPAKGSAIANYAAGATFVPDSLDPKIVKEAVRICGEQGIDIGGVDLAKAGGVFYLLEVNRCPEFRAFTAATGIDVAGAIVDFAAKK